MGTHAMVRENQASHLQSNTLEDLTEQPPATYLLKAALSAKC